MVLIFTTDYSRHFTSKFMCALYVFVLLQRLDEALRAEQTYKNVYVKNLPLELTDGQFKEMVQG
jgi:hypothetical protein